jgi:pimeloyl-ACP methyl ester carboxylesterase
MRFAALSAVVALAALAPAPAAAQEGPRVVRFATADGLTIEADHYPGEEGMPAIVGLHMYPSDRKSWAQLAALRPAGWHFLAVDMRGYGGSRKQKAGDLGERVKKRDATLFAAMWQDAAAGLKFLRDEAKCDPKRIGFIGASVGCSVAIDANIRLPEQVGAVCVLTPGKDYLGVPTMDHVRSWRDTPLLILSSEEEADAGARPIEEALKAKKAPGLELRIVPGTKIHGTDMLGRNDGVEQGILRWFEAVLGREILDGKIDAVEKRDPGVNGSVDPLVGTPEKSIRVRCDSQGVNVLVDGPCVATFTLFVDPAGTADGFANGGKRLRGTASASGELTGAWVDTWHGSGWSEQPVGNRTGIAFHNDEMTEIRIPWSLLGVAPAGQVRIGYAPLMRRPDWRAAPETWKEALGKVVEVPK